MKKLLFLSLAIMIASCNGSKNTVPAETALGEIKPKSVCPPDGKCVMELFRNKSLVIKTDGIGAMYKQMEDAEGTSVIIYQYDRDVPEGLMDANYREEIVFEIKNNDTELLLSGAELQQTKMLFGRFCFCRGQTGYYKVNKGELNLQQNNGKITFRLNFTVSEVPQIIQSAQGIIK